MRRLSSFFVKVMQRFLPDPWVLAIVLSLIVFVAGLLLTGSNPLQMVTFWGDGFFGLLEFSMQMVLILVTGYALASTALVKGALEAVAKRAGNASNAIMITTVFAVVACWLNWGFGLIVGALLAKEMARQVENVDYRLLIAAAYSGFWCGTAVSRARYLSSSPPKGTFWRNRWASSRPHRRFSRSTILPSF